MEILISKSTQTQTPGRKRPSVRCFTVAARVPSTSPVSSIDAESCIPNPAPCTNDAQHATHNPQFPTTNSPQTTTQKPQHTTHTTHNTQHTTHNTQHTINPNLFHRVARQRSCRGVLELLGIDSGPLFTRRRCSNSRGFEPPPLSRRLLCPDYPLGGAC